MNLFQEFISEFNIDPQTFFQRSIPETREISNLRSFILESELQDFEQLLKELEPFRSQLKEFQEVILKRYQLEGRNSFNSNILLGHEEALLKLRYLENILAKNDLFYEKRIKELKDELNFLKGKTDND